VSDMLCMKACSDGHRLFVHYFLLLACFVLYTIIADHVLRFIKTMSQLITDPLKQYL
jgi:hypothetical protein